MAKVSIDIQYIKEALENIGYVISDSIERENNGKNWQFKFSNSGAIVTVYDTNKKRNTVVNGKCEKGEQNALKELVDGLKCKEIFIDNINKDIVTLINSKSEGFYYDFKQQWYTEKKKGDLLHDILCLSNNTENRTAFLIIGVNDKYDAIGVEDWKKENDINDFLKSKKFAGDHIPQIELKKVYYKHFKIDVLVIKSSLDVPYFLTERYEKVGTQIYTRIGDTNTPINESASYSDIERLWEIHFSHKMKDSGSGDK